MVMNRMLAVGLAIFSILTPMSGESEELPSWKPYETGAAEAWTSYVAGDYAKAVPVFNYLAQLGHPVGQFLMGNLYYYGQGVPMDRKLARQFFDKSARQGYVRAFAPLAEMLAQGEGGAIDLVQAYAWYNIAAAQMPDSKPRDEMRKRRDALGLSMNPSQLADAQKRANLFKPQPIIPPTPDEVPPDPPTN